jgi:hypothetical protein
MVSVSLMNIYIYAGTRMLFFNDDGTTLFHDDGRC